MFLDLYHYENNIPLGYFHGFYSKKIKHNHTVGVTRGAAAVAGCRMNIKKMHCSYVKLPKYIVSNIYLFSIFYTICKKQCNQQINADILYVKIRL